MPSESSRRSTADVMDSHRSNRCQSRLLSREQDSGTQRVRKETGNNGRYDTNNQNRQVLSNTRSMYTKVSVCKDSILQENKSESAIFKQSVRCIDAVGRLSCLSGSFSTANSQVGVLHIGIIMTRSCRRSKMFRQDSR